MDTGEKATQGSKYPISNSSSSIKSNFTGRFEGKNRRYFMVKVGVVVNDEKSNQQVAFEAVTVFSSYDRRYIFRRSLNCL